jgi:N-hydroxyarylamine O-acetyltransferase
MDLAAYLGRIGYDGPRAATHAVLAEVVLRQALAIPFENIDAYLGQRVSLDPAVVAQKLVLSGRGGWCFEQNLLLGNALRALGFEVTDLAARVVWGRAADADAARTHRLLCVRIQGQQWLADVGFGGQTLTGVLRMDIEDGQSTPHDPASLFTQMLVVSRATREGRQALRGNELVFHALDGSTRRAVLPDAAALMATLQAVFGITSVDPLRLAARFDAQTGSAARS